MQIFYLKGLNGLRAIAAIAVLISHIMLTYGGSGLDLAGFGVTIFFALSGFLITALLIKERETSGNIHIRKFYIRRILRIWPLYYLYIAFVIFFVLILSEEQFNSTQLFYYLFFAPNIPFVFGGVIGLLAHYWSLGVEEQFYIFWPWVIRKFLPNFTVFSIIFIIVFLCTKIFFNRFYGGYSLAYTFLYVARFDCMVIGGLGAYLFHFKNHHLDLIRSHFFQIGAWTVIGLLFINKFHILSIFDHEIVAFVTVVLIINQISNPQVLISLENKYADYLGAISFGLYVYHPLIISLVIYGFKKLGLSHQGIFGVVFIIAILVGSFLTAHLSYRYFEAWFLKKKTQFAIVQSASSARQIVLEKESKLVGQ